MKVWLIAGLYFSGFSFPMLAQHNSIMLGGGLSTIQGDAGLDVFDLESYGYSITARYIHPFKKNDRWNFTVEYNNSSMVQRGYVNQLDLYKIYARQVFFGVGCRFYLLNTINEYNPYFMEVLPFIQASAGLLSHRMDFKEPFLNRSNFEIAEDSFNGTALQATTGILLILDKRWGLEGYLSIRYDASDSWDGLKGSTSFGDFFGHGGIGVNFAL